ncbi:MAG: ATP-binding cassette domain-containing protein [Candidatus Symbiodolus clandestinus]
MHYYHYFSIEAGSAVAFLGANGAGKSTLIKLLCGILTPTFGHCSLFNQPCGTLQANQQLGLILGTRSQLWSNLTLQQSLIMTTEIYGITGQEQTRRIAELVELWGLGDLLLQRTKRLSLGQRIRSEIASALGDATTG